MAISKVLVNDNQSVLADSETAVPLIIGDNSSEQKAQLRII